MQIPPMETRQGLKNLSQFRKKPRQVLVRMAWNIPWLIVLGAVIDVAIAFLVFLKYPQATNSPSSASYEAPILNERLLDAILKEEMTRTQATSSVLLHTLQNPFSQ